MVNTGSPKWAEKPFRLAAYSMFVVSFAILAFTTYKRYVQDKALGERMKLAHRISLGTTPTLIILIGFMMAKSISKSDITAAMQMPIGKISAGLSELKSVT